MTERPLAIAQVTVSAHGGGAEAVARQLHQAFRGRALEAQLLVGRGPVPAQGGHRFPADWRSRLMHLLAGPARLLDRERGLETYRYPGTRTMLDGLAAQPDVVQLHNLHGGYFDLRVLPELSRRTPVVLTLHDAWLLSGHCAHSFDCERWRTGCGQCPDLTIYPAVKRDATARNWERKRDIFRQSRLYVATPSEWLADRVRSSILAAGVEELRVIPNGVDLATFAPGDRSEARAALGLPPAGFVLLFVGSRVPANPFKDFGTAREAAAMAADLLGENITLLVLGEAGSDEQVGRVVVRYVPFRENQQDMALHYRAADLYVHAARADTFPVAVLEAIACGLPVVASAVGGVPEQVVSLDPVTRAHKHNGHADATGVLVPPGDPGQMGRAIAQLLAGEDLRLRLGHNARADARRRFDIEQQVDAYLAWYRELVPGEHVVLASDA